MGNMTSAEAQAMIEDVLEQERAPMTEAVSEPAPELTEGNFGNAYGAFRTIFAVYKPNANALLTAMSKLRREYPKEGMVKILDKEVTELQTAMAKLEYDFAQMQKRGKIEDVEEPEGEPMNEGADRAIFDALGRLDSDITMMKQAVSQGKLEEASLVATNIVSHAGDVALYFLLVAKKQGFTGNPLKRFEGYLKKFKVMTPATH